VSIFWLPNGKDEKREFPASERILEKRDVTTSACDIDATKIRTTVSE
jgi:hypothetical protein